MTKIAQALPKGDGNGLGAVVEALLRDPHQVHVVVALVDCKSKTVDTDTGDETPTIRVRRIEAISGDDLKIARRLLDRAYDERAGAETLPFELEQDLRSAFGDQS